MLALLACVLWIAGASAAPTPPNIILFLADDMGAFDLGCQGHPTIASPNIDRLAREGMRFTQFYTGHPLCTPSRTSILTGRFASRSGMACGWEGGVLMSDAQGGLPSNESTIAEMLKGAGYDTAMFGKWHQGQRQEYLPTTRGFDSYLGVPYSVDMGTSALINNSATPLPLLDGMNVIEQPVNFNNLTQQYINRALSFVGAHGTGGTSCVSLHVEVCPVPLCVCVSVSV